MKNDPFRFAANRPALDYRWRCGLRSSRWFKTRQAAENAAVRGGMAIREGAVFLPGPLLEIESREAQSK